MTEVPTAADDAWLSLRLFALDPASAGGVCLRAAAGPVRDRWLADARFLIGAQRPWRQVPVHVDEARLLGGLDLAATLQAGRSVAQRGLLTEADGGVIVLAMAERAGASTVAHLASALDTGSVLLARDGIEQRHAAHFGLIALDESSDAGEGVDGRLLDRLALHVDLTMLSVRAADAAASTARLAIDATLLDAARARLPAIETSDAIVEALCAAALALGVTSVRACVFAIRLARMAAALSGHDTVLADDAAIAARLVLAPRATQLPAVVEPAEAAADAATDDSNAPDNSQPEDDASGPEDAASGQDDASDSATAEQDDAGSLEDVVLSAAAAAIPPDLLARMAAGEAGLQSRSSGGRAGALQAGHRHGRPAGVRRGVPRGGARLDLIATLRAAAPWQRLRSESSARREPTDVRSDMAGTAKRPRVHIRADDFHIARKVQRGQTTTIFVVDASGSSALERLAEAKGAVELLLAECYVRRDSVAVLAFRGRGSELLLPPTRSLVRAKRSLAELPGGGGTPLASGLDAALVLALAVRRRGDTPVVVVLTDGRANIGRDGRPGRPQAEADALLAGRGLRAAQLSTVLIDTSPQPQARARDLAAAMQARYLPLPYAGATALSQAVRIASAETPPRPR